MATGTRAELISFHRFLSEKLTDEGAHLSPEEAVDLWRAEHPAPDEGASDVAAVKGALADMEGGDRGLPLEEFDRKFRDRHSIPREA